MHLLLPSRLYCSDAFLKAMVGDITSGRTYVTKCHLQSTAQMHTHTYTHIPFIPQKYNGLTVVIIGYIIINNACDKGDTITFLLQDHLNFINHACVHSITKNLQLLITMLMIFQSKYCAFVIPSKLAVVLRRIGAREAQNKASRCQERDQHTEDINRMWNGVTVSPSQLTFDLRENHKLPSGDLSAF